jgi:hypothetical protein
MTGTHTHTAGHTRHDAWTYRTMNDPRARRFTATRAQRRGVVAAQIVLTGAQLAGLCGLTLTGRLWWAAVLSGALLLWVPATGLLNGTTRGLLELRARMLDERQLAERGTVHTLAHRASLTVMLLAFAAFLLTHRGLDVPLPDLAAPIAVTALGVLVAHWMLPLWIAALRVPDDPADDAVAPA